MSAKALFSRALGAVPGRLHLAAHSHHLWPDVSREAQIACWDAAALLADRKWDKVMGEVWPAAQAEVAAEIGSAMPDAVVFAANTHDFIIRLAAAAPRGAGGALRVLTTDGEFHSARRQFARWVESGNIVMTTVAAEPAATLDARFVAAARAGGFDLILVSQILFGSGRRFGGIAELAELAAPEGPWVVVDGYHSFMAVEGALASAPPARAGEVDSAQLCGKGTVLSAGAPALPFGPSGLFPSRSGGRGVGERCFFLAGGYKYAMSGEGMGMMHCPPGFGPRPPITGWYAEFDDLTLPPEMVGYAPDAMRFMGATFDPSSLYRFVAVRAMLKREGWDTASISAHVRGLQLRLIEGIAGTPLAGAELLNPPEANSGARFLALRDARAAGWQRALMAQGCVTDVRGDVLRIGLGLYHDAADVAAFVALAKAV